jgi:hypothetical protein
VWLYIPQPSSFPFILSGQNFTAVTDLWVFNYLLIVHFNLYICLYRKMSEGQGHFHQWITEILKKIRAIRWEGQLYFRISLSLIFKVSAILNRRLLGENSNNQHILYSKSYFHHLSSRYEASIEH